MGQQRGGGQLAPCDAGEDGLQRVPGLLEFPNLTFYVPEADAQPFIDHVQKVVVGGEVQPSTRMTGVITLKDHDDKDLCEVELKGIDIAKFEPDKSEAGSENIKLVKIEVSLESMKFKYK